ncbi:hypothetical protein BDF22DRAFT_746630 [Syncephalis plumigaleata]|nr:hypothetical protein BDF22DRAFT_746630 [Syncephalis plumigaleata]
MSSSDWLEHSDYTTTTTTSTTTASTVPSSSSSPLVPSSTATTTITTTITANICSGDSIDNSSNPSDCRSSTSFTTTTTTTTPTPLPISSKDIDTFTINYPTPHAPVPRMPTGRPEFHVPHLHLDVLNHSSLSLLRPASPAHVHGMPTTAVVNTSVEQASSASASSSTAAAAATATATTATASTSSSSSSSSSIRHDQTTMSPDITTHNDKVLAPSSFLRRYLRMLHRRENESNNQSSLSRPSSRCASPSVEPRKEQQQVAERETQSSPQRHNDDSNATSQNSVGPAIASLERFIGIERRGRSLSEQLRQQQDSHHHHHHRHELKDDNFSRTSSPQKDLPINIPSPLAQSKFPSHITTQQQQQQQQQQHRQSRQSSRDSLRKLATQWNDESLTQQRTMSSASSSSSNDLPSPCLSHASSAISITSSPVCMDTMSFDSSRSSSTNTTTSTATRNRMTTTAPVSILQTPPMSGSSNNGSHYQQLRQQHQSTSVSHHRHTHRRHHHEAHALRPKARTITGHRRQVSAYTSHPQPVRATSARSTTGVSVPRVTASSYEQLPCSPAVSFLSMFAQSTCGPTEEEEEMLREDEAGDEVGGYVLGCELSRGTFQLYARLITLKKPK